MEGSGGQAASRWERTIYGVKPPQSLTLSAPPKKCTSLETIWHYQQTYLCLAPEPLFIPDFKPPRGAWRPFQLPGSGGLWEVVPGLWVLGRLGWWAPPSATTWHVGAFMVMPGDCCWPDKLLWTPWRTLSILLKVLLGSWRLAVWQKPKLPSLHILKMLSLNVWHSELNLKALKGELRFPRSEEVTDWGTGEGPSPKHEHLLIYATFSSLS